MWDKVKKVFKKRKKSDSNMMLKSRDMGKGRFEVCGVVFNADSHIEAINKYRRQKA